MSMLSKKILALTLSMVILLQFDGFLNVFKIPAIYEHYQHHTLAHGEDLSFFTFLEIHLSNDPAHQHHHDDGHEWPLQPTQAQNGVFLALATLPKNISQTLVLQTTLVLNKTPYQEGYYVSDFLSRVWQPPKLN